MLEEKTGWKHFMKHVGNHGASPKFCAGGRKVFALPNGYIGLYRDEQGSIIDVSGYGKVGKDIFIHFCWTFFGRLVAGLFF